MTSAEKENAGAQPRADTRGLSSGRNGTNPSNENEAYRLALIDACRSLMQDASNPAVRAVELADRAECAILNASKTIRYPERWFKAGDTLGPIIEKACVNTEQGMSATGIPTGFRDLDALVKGLQPGQFTLVGSRPGIGKTAFLLKLAEYAAIGMGKPIGILTLDDTAPEVIRRMLCSRVGVPLHLLHSGRLEELDVKAMLKSAAVFNDAPIWMDDRRWESLSELKALARRLHSEARMTVMMIDPIDFVSQYVSSQEEGDVAMEGLCRTLKGLAVELQIPVVAATGLDRSTDKRDDRRPRLSDLPYGIMERYADIILLLYRHEYYNRSCRDRGMCEVTVARNRNGCTGTIALRFNENLVRFENASVD